MNATMMTVNPFGENMYILWDETSHEAVVVDPGMMRQDERDMVTKFIADNDLKVKHILLTHLHLDHVTSAQWLADQTGADVCGSILDKELGLNLPQQVAPFHIKIESDVLTIDRHLQDGEMIPLGDENIQVLHVPGHSPGGLAFYLPQSGLLISGDTIFNGTIQSGVSLGRSCFITVEHHAHIALLEMEFFIGIDIGSVFTQVLNTEFCTSSIERALCIVILLE